MLEVVPIQESARLRAALEAPPPSLTLLHGAPGAGKSEVVGAAVEGLEAVRYWAAPLADPDHRALLVARLGAWREAPAPVPDPTGRARAALPTDLPTGADWARIFDHLLQRSLERRRTLRLVIEEFPRLVDARSKLPVEIARFWGRVRAHGLPVHLVLTGRDGPVFRSLRSEDPFRAWIGEDIAVEPLGYREVARLFPAWPPAQRLLAWLVFGGHPRHLRPCDPGVALSTNVRQVLLAPDSPFLLEGVERLQIDLQSPGRYASLLAALAQGRREWAEVLAAAPAFESGGQMAPYLARLQELGLVGSEASLDAAPGSRQRRYRVGDPFFAFWYRFVLPHLTELMAGRAKEVWRLRIRPGLDDHAAGLFPSLCRRYLLEHAREALGTTAREVGGLWGADYDLAPAGTLLNGSAFYARALWGGGPVLEAADDALVEEMRRTRYGFGRERRIRLIFATDGFSPALVRRAAREELLHLLGPGELLRG